MLTLHRLRLFHYCLDAIVTHVPASIDTEAPVVLGSNVTKDVQGNIHFLNVQST